MINILCQDAYETAKSKGWYDDVQPRSTALALIHSEVSEALEADRKGDEENFVEELADICIRVFSRCGYEGIDLETVILEKMSYNRTRGYKHGDKRY